MAFQFLCVQAAGKEASLSRSDRKRRGAQKSSGETTCLPLNNTFCHSLQEDWGRWKKIATYQYPKYHEYITSSHYTILSSTHTQITGMFPLKGKGSYHLDTPVMTDSRGLISTFKGTDCRDIPKQASHFQVSCFFRSRKSAHYWGGGGIHDCINLT